MLSLNRARHLSLTVLILGMCPIAGCGAGAGDHGDQGDVEVEGAEIGSAESALTTPTSCAEVKAEDENAPDGEYMLELALGPAEIYCDDMAGTPKEYLTLQNTSSSANFSQYTTGGYVGGTSIRTHYTKVRVDLETLRVDISDTTFSTSTGNIGGETWMSYGVARNCDWTESGVANIDLTGTPFAVMPGSFSQVGWYPVGSATYSSDDQIVSLTGGGQCGMTSPTDGTTGFALPLYFQETL